MKYQGRIQHWDDAKGFGFVEPNGGGTRAFVHISSFLKRSRRPVNGDIIVYEMKDDGKGGQKAASVKLLKDYKNVRSQHNAGKSGSKVAKLVVTVYCSALVLLNLIGQLPVNVTYFCAVISAIAFACYGIDKSAAKHQRWRISESKLHILGLLGGWPGAFMLSMFLNINVASRLLCVCFGLRLHLTLSPLVYWRLTCLQNAGV